VTEQVPPDGICVPTGCALFDASCDQGMTCDALAITVTGQWAGVCRSPGPQRAGEDCSAADCVAGAHCAAGTTPGTATCHALCDDTHHLPREPALLALRGAAQRRRPLSLRSSAARQQSDHGGSASPRVMRDEEALMATNDKDSKATINLSRRDFLGLAGTTGAVLALGSSGSARAAEVDPAARSTALDTRLVTEYGARVPIVSAGMAFVSLVELPVAVTNAGGIGTYGAAPEPPPVVDARLSQIRAAAQGPFGVNFIIASSGLGDFTTAAHIEIAAAHRVPVVSFHWDSPAA
jgi:hypothetical protein